MNKNFLLTRSEMTAAGVTRPVVVLDMLRWQARSQNAPIVICHANDPHRWLVVTPMGSVMGTSLTPMSCVEALELAERVAERGGHRDPELRMDEVGK